MIENAKLIDLVKLLGLIYLIGIIFVFVYYSYILIKEKKYNFKNILELIIISIFWYRLLI